MIVLRSILILFLALPAALVHAQTPIGPEFQVNGYVTGNQLRPDVAVEPTGSFVVVWDSPHDGHLQGVFGQRYDSTGAPQGSEFQLNTYPTDDQGDAAIAADAAGNIVVAWTD